MRDYYSALPVFIVTLFYFLGIITMALFPEQIKLVFKIIFEFIVNI